MSKKVLVICGPSQSGKTTVMQNLINDYPSKYHYAIACTTRPRRNYEFQGKDYFFIEPSEYDLCKDLMVFKTQFADNYYGTTKDQLLDDVVNIVIANEEAIDEFKQSNGEGSYSDLDIVIIGLRKDDITLEREGRTSDHIRMEFDVLRKSDVTINIKPQKYVSTELVNDLSDLLFKHLEKHTL